MMKIEAKYISYKYTNAERGRQDIYTHTVNTVRYSVIWQMITHYRVIWGQPHRSV